jgi:TP901 family phage tail tape measure protein
MADLQKTIEIIFGGVDRVSTVVTTIDRNVSQMADGIGSATAPLASLHDGLLKTEAAAAALAAGGLALAYAKSVEFESAVIELEKVLGEGELGGMASVKQAAVELSEAYGESATEILASTANFKQAGFDLNESMGLTKTAMDLVIAGGLEASRASELLVASLKGFKEPATEAARLVDILNAVSNTYATDVEQLAVGMAGLSPIAKQMGFSMEETAGILTPVIEVFRSGDEAAIALKTGLLKLVDDTAPVKAALASIGVSQTDANGALRSGKDILMDVSEAFQGLEQNQKLYVTQQLVGIDQSARMVEVFDQLNKTTEITQTALNAAGSAGEEVAKRLESAEVQIKIFKTTFENLATVVGDQFKAAATEAIAGGSQIAQALRDSVDSGAFDAVISAFNDFFDDLAETLRGMADVLPEALEGVDFSLFVESLRGVMGEVEGLFDAFFGDVDLTTIDGLADAIQKIVDAGTSLNNIVAGVIEGWQRWAGWLGTLTDKFGGLDEATARNIGGTLQLGKEINVLSGLAGNLSGALGGLGNLLNVLAVKQFAGLIASLGGASAGMASLGSAVAAVSGTAAGAAGLVGMAGAAGYAAGTLINEHVPAVSRAAQAIFEWADELVDFTGKHEAARKETESWNALIDSLANSTSKYKYDLTALREQLQLMGKDVTDLPDDQVIRIAAEADLLSMDTVQNMLSQRVPAEQTVTVSADVEAARKYLEDLGHDLTGLTGEQILELRAIHDEVSFSTTKKQVESLKQEVADPSPYIVRAHDDGTIEIIKRDLGTIPESKTVEVDAKLKELDVKVYEAQLDTVETMVKGYYETIQASVEWEAKLEIAEVEASAKKVEAIMDSVGASVTAAGGVLESMFGNVGELTDAFASWTVERWVEDQIKIQQEGLAMQKELSAAEIELMQARTAAYERGDAQIKIDGAGLQPHLEAFMFEILSAIQIRANQEGANFLVGL